MILETLTITQYSNIHCVYKEGQNLATAVMNDQKQTSITKILNAEMNRALLLMPGKMIYSESKQDNLM